VYTGSPYNLVSEWNLTINFIIEASSIAISAKEWEVGHQ